MRVLQAVKTEAHSSQNAHSIFATIDEMRESVTSVVVTPDALEETPNRWQCREEA